MKNKNTVYLTQEGLDNLKKELEDYKGLIIAKDLEIEKLKKRINIDIVMGASNQL